MNGILHPILKKNQPVMMRKRKMTSGRSQENLSSSCCTKRQAARAERRIISNFDEVHRRYQNNILRHWMSYMVREETNEEKQTTSRPNNVWPDMWTHMSDAAKKKAKQR